MIRRLLAAAALATVATVAQANDWREQAADVLPSVVTVKTVDAATASRVMEIPGFRLGWATKATEYLNRWLTGWRPIPTDQTPTYDSTGFVVEIEGRSYVMTAAHSVEAMSRAGFTVITAEGEQHAAQLIGHEPRHRGADVALLAVPTLNRPALPFAAGTERGEPVAAVGGPAGFSESISAGIVSHPRRSWLATSRNNDVVRGGRDLIQIDARIYQGSSGGPVINQAGEVVGVVSFTHNPTGFGFLVNAKEAQQAAQRIASRCSIANPCDWLAVVQ